MSVLPSVSPARVPGLTIVCVRTGTKYPFSDVLALRRMVRRHLTFEHRFLCYTDQPDEAPGVERVDISGLGLPGWWGKMALFARAPDDGDRILYFDLDTIIVGSLDPLAAWHGEFGICGNFTRAAGHPTYPCMYGSCLMSLGPGFGSGIWDVFWPRRQEIMNSCSYGDQEAIERLHPGAAVLQHELPSGFFLGYRDLPKHPAASPEGCSVVVFGGRNKPSNCRIKWAQEAWQG